MATHKEPEDQEALAISEAQGYETRDFALAPAGKLAAGFYIFTIVSFAVALVGTFLLFRLFTDQSLIGFSATPPRENLPPAPLLQSDVTARTDTRDLRLEEIRILSSYGWVDEEVGLARIPIDQAIDVTAARGLPIAHKGEENRP